MSTETTKDTLPFTCTPAYDRDACKGCVCSTCYEQEFCDRCSSCVEQGHRKERCNAYEGAYNYYPKKDLKKAELFVKSRLLQILFIIIHHPTDRHSLPSSTPPNSAPCQNIHAHHNAEQRRGQEGKSARRGDGPMPFS